MWILHQNKKSLVDVCRIFVNSKCIIGKTQIGSDWNLYTIGEYKTEKRCIAIIKDLSVFLDGSQEEYVYHMPKK